MRTLTRSIPLALAAALIALFAVACSRGGADSKVDDTAREISNEELAQMVLALEDFGGAYEGFQADDDNGFETLEQAAEGGFDSEDEAKDLQEFGWVTSYDADFTGAQAVESRAGVYAVGSDVDLFEDAEGAAGYFADSAAEWPEIAGTYSNGLTVEEVETFDVDVGDEAIGAHIKGYVEDDEGSKIDIWASGLDFRHGRLMGSVAFATFDERTFEEALKGLALVMDERMTGVLSVGAATNEPSGQDGADDSSAEAPGKPSEPLVSSDPVAVLSASAESFGQAVESFRGEFETTMTMGDFYVGMRGDMAFQGPDRMHMTMDVGGDTMEFLMVLPDFYIRVPGEGWYVLNGDAFGFDPAVLQEYMDNRGLVDYSTMADELDGLTRLPDEEIDGVTYLHYQGDLDVAELAQEVPGGLFDPGAIEQAEELLQAVGVEIWLEKDTYLPYQIDMGMTVSDGEMSIDMDMSMKFFDYNQPVDIPLPPADAEPFGAIQA
jgi:predicted RNase H-like HicB family nuclease